LVGGIFEMIFFCLLGFFLVVKPPLPHRSLVRIEIKVPTALPPYLVAPTSAPAQAVESANVGVKANQGLRREGGSIPIVNDFKRILKAIP